MPLKGRRKLLFRARDSNWISIIPSAYSLSLFDFGASCLTTTANSKLASFYKYVEGQRLPRGITGAKSLRDTTIEVLIRNLSKLKNLEDVPKHLSRSVWDTLKRRCMLSFHSWKLLSKALHTDENITLGMFHYSKVIRSPESCLHIYTKPLTSKTFDFIASLSLNLTCTVAELVQLADISNLGILEIINPNECDASASGVGDIVLRAWSREASKNGAFSVLRVLRLWNHQDLTEKSLDYIQMFSALTLFDIRACGINKIDEMAYEAEKLGWQTVRDKSLFGVMEVMCDRDHNQICTKSFAKPLWLGSKVHKLDRSHMLCLFTIPGTSPAGISRDNLNLPNTDSLPNTDAERWPDYVQDVAHGDEEWVSLNWDLFCNAGCSEAWESDYAACWARIGELCEDRDLMLAGVEGIEKQTFVGPHLVSPVPMAYIRLGDLHRGYVQARVIPGLSASESMEEPTIFQGCVTFIRTSSNSRVVPYPQSRIDSQSEHRDGKREVGGRGRMRSIKKQRLDDVLNGFQIR